MINKEPITNDPIKTISIKLYALIELLVDWIMIWYNAVILINGCWIK